MNVCLLMHVNIIQVNHEAICQIQSSRHFQLFNSCCLKTTLEVQKEEVIGNTL